MVYIEELAKRLKPESPSKFADTLYGQVISISPLTVKVDTGMELTSDFLEVGRFGKARKVNISGLGDVMMTERLEVGDRVALMRGHGGQRFYITDRS
ncbi:DUF2577 domain-containing protein [Lactococcus lactis]|uniref:DUF2577 domain-containing protein n=1 Tax=Lactococcus lactis TaxID=1358 RepID=A0A6B3S316_9LACT|nr:DUF2577 family protein [Lactococcus lactis]MCT1174174.1 DUF2577 domain-containing protein [Lactococcus lactis]MCT1186481.1 DUF2577 domain-containing protein [Lactococcus lactis]MCT1189573.1 DUF2577 domain-containing protein [Lactococcus lactis]MCT1195251.1 DUF2577 domain-containing protein [Lactococcus lactis]NEX49339.1 DUF2577 domain-containing protein [Lactococcus lactis]